VTRAATGRVRWAPLGKDFRAMYCGAALYITSRPDGYYAHVDLGDEVLYAAGPMALASAKLSCRNAVLNTLRSAGLAAANMPGDVAALFDALAATGAVGTVVNVQVDAAREVIDAWVRQRARREHAAAIAETTKRLARGA
jgi:hypothetical protein